MALRPAAESRMVGSEYTAETGHSPLVEWGAVERTRTLDFFRRRSGEACSSALLELVPGILATPPRRLARKEQDVNTPELPVQEDADTEPDPCAEPCDPDRGCPYCAEYWERMVAGGFWNRAQHRWTDKGYREQTK